jgi:predicted  nucleic acid-binding Zn-ribbon protein
MRNSTSVELQGLDLSIEDLQKRIAAARPALERAHARGEQILEDLERKTRAIERSMGSLGGVDDLRLYYALRDEVATEVDTYDWDQLQHASETLPIFVRDALQRSVQERLDSISQRVVMMRDEISNDTRELVGAMNQELAAQFEALRLPHQLELSFQFDPAAFSADLQKVGTITIGSTLALTIASVFAIGGPIGAVVVLGGLLVRHAMASAYRTRVKDELKKTLDPALNTLIQDLFNNIKTQVDQSMNGFREEIEGLLQSAISNVENTLGRLEKERQSAEFDSGDRQERLRARKTGLEELEADLSLIVGPGF